MELLEQLGVLVYYWGGITSFTGIGTFILLKVFKEEPIIGLATGSTAGDAVATPVVVTAAAIICLVTVSYVFKMLNNKKAKKLNNEVAVSQCVR